MKLTPKSSIAELVEYICNKRQATGLSEKLTKVLVDQGGANIVQDLYGWDKEDFTGPKLQIKPTYIF
jgi:L-amino acid N-acyltransferase YncA